MGGLGSVVVEDARYDVYKLDYRCYVDLLATTKAPDKLLDLEDAGASVNV